MSSGLENTNHTMTENLRSADIAVIGAGAAGTSAAAAFARQGFSVVLIDVHARHPIDFRAEKIGQRQMDYLTAFGLGEAAYRQMTAFDGVWVHRFGRIVEKKNTREYSSHYQDFVNALRDALAPGVEVAIGRVEHVEAGPDRQLVALADGRRYEARLLVLATGLGEVILRKLGIERKMLSANHSLAFGFDLTNPPSSFPFPSLVYTVEGPRQQAAHLTFFPMGERMRANFFTYRQVNEPWTRAFRQQPAETLDAFMPGVGRMFGPIGIEGHVSARPIDLIRAEDYRRAGVVLVGDAFFTVCPSSGTGMDKALHDVERLTHYLPRWFASPGMAAEKISQFYDDSLKLARDAHAMRISLRARSMRMDKGIAWRARRLRSAVLVRAAYRTRDLLRPLAALPFSR